MEDCAAIEVHYRYDNTACLNVKRANGIDFACEWLPVQPGDWTPARWVPEIWTPGTWTPEVWTEGSALVRYGEYEVFAQGSVVQLEQRQGYYATLSASHNATDYKGVLLKRSTCETDGNPDIEVLTQQECCGTGDTCGVCSTSVATQLVREPQQPDSDGVVADRSTWPLVHASSVTTQAMCEAIGFIVDETCVDDIIDEVVTDCIAGGYEPGSVSWDGIITPSTTCPSGCVQTDAVFTRTATWTERTWDDQTENFYPAKPFTNISFPVHAKVCQGDNTPNDCTDEQLVQGCIIGSKCVCAAGQGKDSPDSECAGPFRFASHCCVTRFIR